MEQEYIDVNDIPLREVLEKYSKIEKEERERGGFKCCCPIHKDDTPSFKVYDDNTFHCFGCRIAGGPVDLVRMLFKLPSNKEAEEILRKEYNINEDSIPTIEGLCRRKGLSINIVTEKLKWKDTEAGILMPYEGTEVGQLGELAPTYKIRKKYKGSPKYIKDGKNINIPYGLSLLSEYDINKTLYITEGETDMATLLQAGYQVLGIPRS